MALYMYQFAYTADFLGRSGQEAGKSNRNVGRGWRGRRRQIRWRMAVLREYDAVLIADMPNMESMAAIALAIAAGGTVKTSKTTALMTGTQGVEALQKADGVANIYRPAK